MPTINGQSFPDEPKAPDASSSRYAKDWRGNMTPAAQRLFEKDTAQHQIDADRWHKTYDPLIAAASKSAGASAAQEEQAGAERQRRTNALIGYQESPIGQAMGIAKPWAYPVGAVAGGVEGELVGRALWGAGSKYLTNPAMRAAIVAAYAPAAYKSYVMGQSAASDANAPTNTPPESDSDKIAGNFMQGQAMGLGGAGMFNALRGAPQQYAPQPVQPAQPPQNALAPQPAVPVAPTQEAVAALQPAAAPQAQLPQPEPYKGEWRTVLPQIAGDTGAKRGANKGLTAANINAAIDTADEATLRRLAGRMPESAGVDATASAATLRRALKGVVTDIAAKGGRWAMLGPVAGLTYLGMGDDGAEASPRDATPAGDAGRAGLGIARRAWNMTGGQAADLGNLGGTFARAEMADGGPSLSINPAYWTRRADEIGSQKALADAQAEDARQRRELYYQQGGSGELSAPAPSNFEQALEALKQSLAAHAQHRLSTGELQEMGPPISMNALGQPTRPNSNALILPRQ